MFLPTISYDYQKRWLPIAHRNCIPFMPRLPAAFKHQTELRCKNYSPITFSIHEYKQASALDCIMLKSSIGNK
jgi:hypothetical protein